MNQYVQYIPDLSLCSGAEGNPHLKVTFRKVQFESGFYVPECSVRVKGKTTRRQIEMFFITFSQCCTAIVQFVLL